VRHDHERRTSITIESKHELEDLLGITSIEIASRFVGKYQRRFRHERPSHGGTLTLTARELMRTMRETTAESDLFENRTRPRFRLDRCHASNQQGHRHILERAELRQEMVELVDESDRAVTQRAALDFIERVQISAFDTNAAERRSIETPQNLQ